MLKRLSPAWRINIGYAMNWTNQSEVATAASDSYRDFAQEEYGKIILETASIKTVSGSNIEKSFNTLLANQSDALLHSQRIKSLFEFNVNFTKFPSNPYTQPLRLATP